VKKVDVIKVNRLMDANFNRAKEGLRVCEDICRFVCDHAGYTRSLKNIRHGLTETLKPLKLGELILSRAIERDVGRGSIKVELKRDNFSDVFYANSQRVKESIRVLEEMAKLSNVSIALRLKKLRYNFYAVEKKVTEECAPVFNSRHRGR
jgi:thiamine-phosphate pyrophosphorylase